MIRLLGFDLHAIRAASSSSKCPYGQTSTPPNARSNGTDLTVEILKQIRDNTEATVKRLESVEIRLGGVERELGGLHQEVVGLQQGQKRLAAVELQLAER